jgi:hypothetical protein
VIASAQRGGLVRDGQQRVGLGAGQEAHVGGIGAFLGDRQDALDEQGVFGALQRGVAEQGVDRGQAGVAGGDAVVPVGLQVVQEPADEAGIDVGQVQRRGWPAEVLLGVAQQQAEGVAVGVDGVLAGPALGQPLGEEPLQDRGQAGHHGSCQDVSNRVTAWAINCGQACRYQ